MFRRILEIGPGMMPSHHEGGIRAEGDRYTAVDQSAGLFESETWKKIKAEYGDRVQLVVGNRTELPEGEYDEIISLGSFSGAERQIIEQAGRFLAPGGKLVFGMPPGELFNVADFLDDWKGVAKEHGLTYHREQGKTYDYGKLASEVSGTERPSLNYATVVFVKE